MRKSWLPSGGTNLFQDIKRRKVEARARGIKLLDLAIGQPAGSALSSAREVAAEAVLMDVEAMHGYQDNGADGVNAWLAAYENRMVEDIPAQEFSRRFVDGHTYCSLKHADVDYVPISGIKPMLGLIPLACGSDLKIVVTTTNPGYPTPKDWCRYLGKTVFEPEMNPGNFFLFEPKKLPKDIGLIMTNYPHNPSGAIAKREYWQELCAYCQEHGIRLFNDAAYAALSYDKLVSSTLADVAIEFPKLSWAEAFSASKLIGNGTGWRVGAIVGSPDFIADIKTIKGNTDSGFVAPMAVGALFSLEKDTAGVDGVVELYQYRSALLCEILLEAGMRLATQPKAGFFTLWQVPKTVFGKEVQDAEAFNYAMIEGDGKVGVVGVHFHPYIRYAVASADIKSMADEIRIAFLKARVGY